MTHFPGVTGSPTKQSESSTLSVVIEITRTMGIEIEELCINEGITISAYLTRLHEKEKTSKQLLEEREKISNVLSKEEEEITIAHKNPVTKSKKKN